MDIFYEALLSRRLKKALAHHGCHMANGVETLRDDTRVTLEPNMKLSKAKIHSSALRAGAYTGAVSGYKFLEVISIGRFCSIATGVMIGRPRRSHPIHRLSTHAFTTNPKLLRKPLQPEHGATPTRIDHDIWIGRDALILDRVEIGTGAVIGAQSLVNRDASPYAVVTGSPVRVLHYRSALELIERPLASRWWKLPLDVLGELPPDDPQTCVETLERRSPQACQETRRLRIRHKPFATEWLS